MPSADENPGAPDAGMKRIIRFIDGALATTTLLAGLSVALAAAQLQRYRKRLPAWLRGLPQACSPLPPRRESSPTPR